MGTTTADDAARDTVDANSATILGGTTILEVGTIGGGLMLSLSSTRVNSKDFKSPSLI